MSERDDKLLHEIIEELNSVEEKLNGSFVLEKGEVVFMRWSDNARISMVDVISGLSSKP